MNRMKLSPLATADLKQRQSKNVDEFSFSQLDQLATRSKEDYSSFVPLHYEKNYAYPLVVWLHSDGGSSTEINRILPQASMRNFVGVAPQAPVGNFEAGYYWEQDADSIDMAHTSIMSSVDATMARYNISSQRIYLAGSGAGGTMAFRIALERPDVFAGVISIDGPMPTDQKPLSSWALCRDLPIFWAHSRKSESFNESLLCSQLRLLHIAGFSVTLRQYPGQDCLIPKTFSDMNSWIMEMISSSIR